MNANEEPFLAKLAELARVRREELHEGTAIQPAEWDSVDLLDLIAAIDDGYGVTVDTKELSRCRTIGELRSLVEAVTAQQ